MKNFILTAMFYSFAAITFFLGSFIVITAVMLRFPKRKTFCYISRIWAKAILAAGGIKVSVNGLENISFDGPKIFVSNHQGNFDIPVLIAALPAQFRFLVKKELFKVPFFGWYLRGREDVSIDRQNSKSAMRTLKELSRIVKRGEIVLIFPEGTRSRDGSVGDFKRGSLILASTTASRVVPIGISGSFNIQKSGNFLINPAEVIVNIGKGEAFDDGKQDALRGKIISLMANR